MKSAHGKCKSAANEHGVDCKIAPQSVFLGRGRSNDRNTRVVGVRLRPQADEVEGHGGVGRHAITCNGDANSGGFEVLGLFRGGLDDADADC